jgi:hypothetical protein
VFLEKTSRAREAHKLGVKVGNFMVPSVLNGSMVWLMIGGLGLAIQSWGGGTKRSSWDGKYLVRSTPYSVYFSVGSSCRWL